MDIALPKRKMEGRDSSPKQFRNPSRWLVGLGVMHCGLRPCSRLSLFIDGSTGLQLSSFVRPFAACRILKVQQLCFMLCRSFLVGSVCAGLTASDTSRVLCAPGLYPARQEPADLSCGILLCSGRCRVAGQTSQVTVFISSKCFSCA